MKSLRILLCFLLFSCSPSSSLHEKKFLRIGFSTYPATIDPRKSGDFASSTLICLLFEGLTRCLPGDEVELALAERIEISEDQKTYTFFLREACWSDGEPITAHDFEKSWKKILNPSFPSLCPYLLYPIKNGELYASGKIGEEAVGIHALDARTLQVELERPTPHFVSLTAFPLLLPIPSHIEEQNPHWDQELAKLVCSGPFFLSKIKANASISLTKNEHFWNRDAIALDGILISIVPDEMTALQMFERGDLDWIGAPLSPLPPDALSQLKNLRFTPMAASTFCTFNTQKFPFHNRALRKAFSCAIDREKIVREITQLGQIPAERSLPPSLTTGKKILFQSDPKEAKVSLQIALEELQITPADFSLTLYYKPGQIDRRLAQTLQRQWLEVLGISVKLVQLDAKTHMKKLHEGNYQLSLACWIAQFHDPINLLERFKEAQNPKNYAQWHNREYADLLQCAIEELDRAQRASLLEKAEEIFANEIPIAPLYHWSTPSLIHSRVKNLSFTASGGVLFERCSIETQE